VGGETCQAWGGHGEITLTLPLHDGGHTTLTGGFTARGSEFGGLWLGQFGKAQLAMAVHFRPEAEHVDQDCVRKPYNHFVATAHGSLAG
jgi:hypothetical protein